jgi:hypothetical protein
MNNLPSKTTVNLINALENGEIDNTEAAKRIAQIHTASTENYAQTLTIGIVIAGISWALTGGRVINQRHHRLQAFKHISQGQILEYLPDEERELFETLLSETPTEQGFQNPEDQGAAHTLPETVAQSGIHPQLLDIECGNVAEVVTRKMKPLIMTARPRVGKGIITAHSIAYAKQRYGASVWVLQPKPTPSELGYWKQADRFLGIYLEDYEIDDPAIAEKMTAFFREWRSAPGRPTMLVIDELVKIQAMQPTWYKKFLIPQCLVEASSGETDNRFLWLLTQSPLVSDLGMSGGNRSTFDLMTLQTEESAEHCQSVRKSLSSLVTVPTSEHFQKSPVGILVFHSAFGKWAAVPSLPVPTIAPTDRLCPEIMALVQPGSIVGSTSEPGLNRVQDFEPGSNIGSTREPYTQKTLEADSSNPVHGSVQPSSDPEPMPNRARVVVELNRKGMAQTEIIELIWGVKKGGTKGYQTALEEFRAIVSEYGA